MIRATTFAGRHVAVFGLGASGNATAQALLAGGASVAAWDDSAAGRDAAARQGVPVVDLARADWSRLDALVLAPGVPLTHPEPHWCVQKARAAGIEIIGDIEIFCRERAAHCPNSPFVAITGTNGKSTTTALIAHVLREAGRDTQMGGNIGKAILTLEPPARERIHVVEMSSFQIDLTPSLAPSVGVLLNLTPDHLDRHGPADDLGLAMRNYAAIKERLVAASTTAIIGIDDDWCRAIAERRRTSGKPLMRVSVTAHADVTYEGGRLLAGPARTPVADLAGVGTLRGAHNGQNAGMAFGALTALGLGAETIARAMRTYPGLAHRMEEVGRAGKVLFLNDSKATNADSTEKALAAFAGGIHVILGGKPKEGGIASLAPYFPRLAKAYLIGAASDAFAQTLEGHVPFARCGTLEAAVAAAAHDAAASAAQEPVVLLSPACASYDQFKNFEDRGETFRRLVLALPGVRRSAP